MVTFSCTFSFVFLCFLYINQLKITFTVPEHAEEMKLLTAVRSPRLERKSSSGQNEIMIFLDILEANVLLRACDL